MRYQLTSTKILKIKKIDHTKCWKGGGRIGVLIHCWWGCKMVQPLKKMVWQFLKKLKFYLPNH